MGKGVGNGGWKRGDMSVGCTRQEFHERASVESQDHIPTGNQSAKNKQ